MRVSQLRGQRKKILLKTLSQPLLNSLGNGVSKETGGSHPGQQKQAEKGQEAEKAQPMDWKVQKGAKNLAGPALFGTMAHCQEEGQGHKKMDDQVISP